MKALGVGANVYWENGRDFETKHSVVKDTSKPNKVKKPATPAVENNELSTAEMLKLAKDSAVQANTKEELLKLYSEYVTKYPALADTLEFKNIFTNRKKQLGL